GDRQSRRDGCKWVVAAILENENVPAVGSYGVQQAASPLVEIAGCDGDDGENIAQKIGHEIYGDPCHSVGNDVLHDDQAVSRPHNHVGLPNMLTIEWAGIDVSTGLEGAEIWVANGHRQSTRPCGTDHIGGREGARAVDIVEE